MKLFYEILCISILYWRWILQKAFSNLYLVFHHNKSPFWINNIDINKIVVYNKVSLVKVLIILLVAKMLKKLDLEKMSV